MHRGALVAMMLMILVLAPVVAGNYTHLMADGQGTGIVNEGPDRPDTLWRKHIGGTRAALNPPLMHAGEVFVASLRGDEDPRADVWRLDQESGEGRVWLSDLPALMLDDFYTFNMVIAHGQLIVNLGNGLAGYDLDGDGSPVWWWNTTDSAAPSLGDHPITLCGMASEDGRFIAQCLYIAAQANDPSPRRFSSDGATDPSFQSQVISFILDECDGHCAPAWVWNRDAQSSAEWPFSPGEGASRPGPGEANSIYAPYFLLPSLVTIEDGYVALTYPEHQHVLDAATHLYDAPDANVGYSTVWVLDAETGNPLWDERSNTWAIAGEPGNEVAASDVEEAGVTGDFVYMHMPVIHDGLLYYTLNRELRTVGIDIWTSEGTEIGARTDRIGWAVNSITIRDPDLWIASVDKVFRLDLESHETLAQASAAGSRSVAESWTPLTPLLLAKDTLYVSSYPTPENRTFILPGGTQTTIHSFEADTLTSKWRLRLEDGSVPRANTFVAEFAASDGIMILHTRGGDVIALGGDGGGLDAIGPNLYPEVGDEVRIEILTEADRYQFDWGDGSELAWTDQPVATATYERAETYHVSAIAENDGHWTSQEWTITVDGAPPNSNALSNFIAENPDAAWGIFGLIIVLTGAAFTSYRLARRRGLMARELAAIDAIAADADTSSPRLRVAMDERRARAHGLLVDHKIDESQYQILTKRIDEVGRGARMHQLRGLFDFLPYAMVHALEEMLEDGQITAVEHHGIKAMLDGNKILTKAQKHKVQSLVDGWFAQDEGARS